MTRTICIWAMIVVSFTAHAQIELIRQSFHHTALDSILQTLHQDYGLKYAYQSESIDHIKTSWSYKGNNLNQALVSLFDPLDLEYKIVRDDLILVREKNSSGRAASFKYHIKGKVIDGTTGEALSYANIHLPNNEIAYTDENGAFDVEFEHDSIEGELLFTYLAYAKVAKTIRSTSTSFNKIKLYPFTNLLHPVEVYSRQAVLSKRDHRQDVFVVEPSFGYSVQGFNDPLSALQSLPGIANFNESGGLLHIRGGDDFDNYIILDGLPLYKVDHFFGYFSSISNDVVEDISIYKNAFPAEYGGKSSSVIDIASKELDEEIHGSASLGLLYTSAAVELPITDQLEVFAGLRINNLNLANNTFSNLTEQQNGPGRLLLHRNPKISYENDHDPSFSFYDTYLKLNYKASPSTNFFINFFHGADHFNNELLSTYTWRAMSDRFHLTEFYQDENRWSNTGSSIQWEQEWHPRFSSKLSFAYSSHHSATDIRYTIEKVTNEIVQDELAQHTQNQLKGIFLNLNNTYALDQDHNLNFGLQLSRENTSAQISTINKTRLDRTDEGSVWSAYYEYQGEIGALSLTGGMRHNYYLDLDRIYHSPRLFMKYDFTPNLYTKASWSIYQQFVRQLYHESPTGRTHYLWVLANAQNIPVLERQHFMLGFGGFWKQLSLDVEAYDIRSTGELEHALSVIGFDPMSGRPQFQSNALFFQGTGRTLGMDVFLRWHGEEVQPFLSYTLSKSTVSFDEINEGEPILAQNDRRHQMSAGINYTPGQWDFQLQYHFASGRPYTDLNRYKTNAQDRRTQLSIREDRLPSYQRCDVSAAYTFQLGKSKLQLKGSVFNLFNRENVKYYQYMYSITQPENTMDQVVLGFDQSMLGFIPNVEVNWVF